MKKIVYLGLPCVLLLTGCTDSNKNAEIALLNQQLEQATERANSLNEALKAQVEAYEKIDELISPYSEHLEVWNDALEACKGVQSETCDEVRESFSELQVAISNHASVTLNAIKKVQN